MKSDLIDVNQLKDAVTSMSSTAEESAKALQKFIEVIANQHLISCSEPSEVLVEESDYPLNYSTLVSGTLSLSDIYNPTLVALQCKSCGAAIDKNTMTCTHCGMAYMLVNSGEEFNPKFYSF